MNKTITINTYIVVNNKTIKVKKYLIIKKTKNDNLQ